MRRRTTLAALAMIPVLALGTAGCGAGGGDTGSSAAAKKADDLKKMREFAKCMRANGLPDFPDPSADGTLVMGRAARKGTAGAPTTQDEQKMQAAHVKCRHLMPNGGKPPTLDAKAIAEERAISKCMREHGVTDFPDPGPDGGIQLRVGEGTNMDPESKVFQDADNACNKGRGKGPRFAGKPGAPGGGGSGGGGTTGGSADGSSGGSVGGGTGGGGK